MAWRNKMKTLRLIHTADFHLGISFRNIIGANVQEARRRDFERNVERIFDEAIKRRVDLMLICGDIFHRSDPSNRDLVFVAKQIGRAITSGVRVVAIAGNHDKPKVAGAMNPLKALVEAKVPNFYFFQELPKEPLIIDIKEKNMRVGIVPIPFVDPRVVRIVTKGTMSYDGFMYRIINKISSDTRLEDVDAKILMGHLTLSGARVKRIWGIQINEPTISMQTIHTNVFDYIALGHVHTFQSVNDKVYYAGSIERIDFSEMGEDKKFIYAEISDGEIVKVEAIQLECRPMLSTGKINIVGSANPIEVLKRILESISIPPESILRLEIETDEDAWRVFEKYRNGIEDFLFNTKRILGYVLKKETIRRMIATKLERDKILPLRKIILEYIKSMSYRDEQLKRRVIELAEKLLDEVGIH